MKKFTNQWLFLLLFVVPMGLKAQIPNPDFESWDSITIKQPNGYRVYGITTKVLGYNGTSAAKIEKNYTINDGPGAVIHGNPENGFSGGIPAIGRPDSAIGYFKYHLVPDDTAWYLVYFKRNGILISEDIFKITGTDSMTWQRLAFKINYSDTGMADSLIIGIASSNPNDQKVGSFVIVDNLHFTGGIGTITIPNGDFEQWQSIGYNHLNGWLSSDNRGITGTDMTVTKTSDHALTKYACQIKNTPIGNGEYNMGYIMAGRQGNNGPKPGFKVQGRDSILYCNYKFMPQGGDTMNIAILMYKNDTMIGLGRFTQWQTVNNWTLAAIPITYSVGNSAIPDSGALFCSAFIGGSMARGNSVLYVDGLSLNKPASNMKQVWKQPTRMYPNPASYKLIFESQNSISNNTIVSFYDLNGKKIIASYTMLKDGKTLSIETDNLSEGVWYYEIINGDSIENGKIIIKK